MTGAYQHSSPEKVILEVTAFRDELRAMGIGNDSDRLCQTLRLASEFEAALESVAKLHELLRPRSYLQVAQVLSELEDFRQIYRGFRGELAAIAPKLRRCLDGALNLADEAAKASGGRNTAFELSLASSLKLRGVQIVVEDECDGDSDVVCLLNGVKVRIACKRSYSADNISNAIKKAKRQLRRGLRPDTGDIGIIAVCVSRPLYQRFKGVPTIENPFVVDSVFRRLTEEIFAEHFGAYKKIRDENIVAMFFRLAGPVVFQGPGDPPNLTSVQFWNCRKWRELKREQDDLLFRFGRLFNQSIPLGQVGS